MFFVLLKSKSDELIRNKLGLSWAKLSPGGAIGLIKALFGYCRANDGSKSCYRSNSTKKTTLLLAVMPFEAKFKFVRVGGWIAGWVEI